MALERDPQLLEYAFSKNIILTFPTSLLAILKGLAMTIQQAEIAKTSMKFRAMQWNCISASPSSSTGSTTSVAT